ncbi:hypothetical protein ACNS7O_18960 (plasmid) [Haloferacaceae archaeon DSL9]
MVADVVARRDAGLVFKNEAECLENQAANRMDRQVMPKLRTYGIFDEDSKEPPRDDLSNEYYTVVTETVDDE